MKAKLSNVTEELSRKGEAVVTLTRELEGSRDVGDGLKLRLKVSLHINYSRLSVWCSSVLIW